MVAKDRSGMNALAPAGPAHRAGFLLVGGTSTRMGTNKAFLTFNGQTLLERGLQVLKSVCGNVALVGNPVELTRFGAVVGDVFAGCGPLAGVHAALAHSKADYNAMLAVDMPLVSAGLLELLFGITENSGAIVTVPRAGGGLQPLCAIYRREFAATAEAALGAGNYKLDAAFDKVLLRIVEASELAEAGHTEEEFSNVNTPEEWARMIANRGQANR